jgi:hypothetical protein
LGKRDGAAALARRWRSAGKRQAEAQWVHAQRTSGARTADGEGLTDWRKRLRRGGCLQHGMLRVRRLRARETDRG